MFKLLSLGLIGFALLLSGCGSNPDYGKSIKIKSAGATISAAATTTATITNITLAPCKNTTVYTGSGGSSSQDFAGSSVCASTSNLYVVRVRMNAQFSPTTRLCVVPLNFSTSFAPTCLAVNGQADVTLSTDQFTAVTLVLESNMSAYQSYLNGQVSSYPAMAYAALR